jgi:cell division protein FtsZ
VRGAPSRPPRRRSTRRCWRPRWTAPTACCCRSPAESDLGLFEINEAASLVQEAAHEDANIIFGTVIDDSLGDEVRVTVIAAGFDSTPSVMPPVGRVYGGGTPAPTPAPFGQSASGSLPNPSGLPPLGPPAGGQPGGDYYRPEGAPAPARSYQPGPGPSVPPPPNGLPVGNPRALALQDDEDDDEVDVPPFMKN